MFRFLLLILLPIVCFSADFSLMTFQKSGTHIYIKLFQEKFFGGLFPTDKKVGFSSPDMYYSVHFTEYEEVLDKIRMDPDHRVVLNIRDPRALALSMVDWTIEHGNMPFKDSPRKKAEWNLLSYREKVKSLFQPEIWGESRLLLELRCFSSFMERVPAENIYLSSFEKMVGSKGGGDDEIQKEEVLAIAEFFGLVLNDSQGSKIAQRLYGATYTFRKGKIDRWKEIFDEELYELSQPFLEEFMHAYGYK